MIEVWELLKDVRSYDFSDLLTSNEILLWRDRTFSFFHDPFKEPKMNPHFFTDEIVSSFVDKAADRLGTIFKEWDDPFFYPQPIKEREFSMELQEIKQKLEETRFELLGILDGLREDQMNKQRDFESWSIAQVCQHLCITEELYIVAIKRGLKSKEDSFIEYKPVESLLDRSNKLAAPEIAKPTTELWVHQVIIEKLNHTRQKLHELLNTIEDPSVLSRRHYSHPVFKEMLLIDWLKSLYLHEQRHIKQIQEIRDRLE
ncbi:DinB family protein [uncultured Paenibacillus sp.]|uniref:DinB family protein n=1 Tax=uncultured Paenibacillus sp. TaxID=227322 RepID=UPI00280445AC|nr:DinB family protein [uncultured Paenibacillus sp.]